MGKIGPGFRGAAIHVTLGEWLVDVHFRLRDVVVEIRHAGLEHLVHDRVEVPVIGIIHNHGRVPELPGPGLRVGGIGPRRDADVEFFETGLLQLGFVAVALLLEELRGHAGDGDRGGAQRLAAAGGDRGGERVGLRAAAVDLVRIAEETAAVINREHDFGILARLDQRVAVGVELAAQQLEDGGLIHRPHQLALRLDLFDEHDAVNFAVGLGGLEVGLHPAERLVHHRGAHADIELVLGVRDGAGKGEGGDGQKRAAGEQDGGWI